MPKVNMKKVAKDPYGPELVIIERTITTMLDHNQNDFADAATQAFNGLYTKEPGLVEYVDRMRTLGIPKEVIAGMVIGAVTMTSEEQE